MLKYKLFGLLVMFTVFCSALAQTPAKTITPKTVGDQTLKSNHKHSDDDCIFNDKLSLAIRLSKYPFSGAVKIAAVSYSGPMSVDFNPKDKKKPWLHKGLIVVNGKLNRSTIKEYVVLNTSRRNNLTNIIFNTTYRKINDNASEEGGCFDPRNAFLFYDKNGRIFDYIQVCFECHSFRSLSGKLDIGTICNQKYDLLSKFLVDAGIKYGTRIVWEQ
ncbi:MAG TPA: hypothetical protein VIM55_06340 [Mucilaginibacter sp.]